MLWHHDRHPDHETAAALSKIALRQAGTILNDPKARAPRQNYCYDNGPGHTIGFEPNTFVNVTDTWIPAMGWLG
jgi:LmbE family N-acetylglucosaminyl deacetylase